MLYRHAQWFAHDTVLAEDFLSEYLQESWETANIPSVATTNLWVQIQVGCGDADLVASHNRTLDGVRKDSSKKVMDGFNRTTTFISTAHDIGRGMLLFRTHTDRRYLTNNNEVSVFITSWRGSNVVDRVAFVCPQPLLKA